MYCVHGMFGISENINTQKKKPVQLLLYFTFLDITYRSAKKFIYYIYSEYRYN